MCDDCVHGTAAGEKLFSGIRKVMNPCFCVIMCRREAEVHSMYGHINRGSRNVDVYPQKQQVLDTLCVQLINIPALMPVFLFQIRAPSLVAHLQAQG